MTVEQANAILMIADAIIDIVKVKSENGPGVPAGELYAALMTQGCTLHQFNEIMSMTVEAGRVRIARSPGGDVYYI